MDIILRPNNETFYFLTSSIRRPKLENNVRFMAFLGLVLGLLVLSVALLSGWGWLGLPFLANFSFLTSSSMVILSSMALGAVLGCLPTAGEAMMDYCTRSDQNPSGNGSPSSVVSNHGIQSGNNQPAAMFISGSKLTGDEAIPLVQNPPGYGAPSSVVSNHAIKSGNNQTAAPSATSATSAMSIFVSKPTAGKAIHSSQPLGRREMPSANQEAPNPTTLTPLAWVSNTLNVQKLTISTTPFLQFKQPPREVVFGSTGSVSGGVILGGRRR